MARKNSDTPRRALQSVPANEFEPKYRAALEAAKFVLQEYTTAAREANDEPRLQNAALMAWLIKVGSQAFLREIKRNSPRKRG